MKQLLLDAAADAGFDEVRLVSPRPFDRWKQDALGLKLCHDPAELLPGISSIAVLFRRYSAHRMHWSQYYVCSNESYNAVKSMAQSLAAQGITAVPNPALPHRAAALRSGGILGNNSLYIHPQYGTRFSLHLLLLKGIQPDDDGLVQPCSDTCSLCAKACPGGALMPFSRDKCIRNYLSSHDMPPYLRGHVHRIFGCDICQDVCPHNVNVGFGVADTKQQKAFDIARLLKGDTDDAQGYVGTNYGGKKRLACHAVLWTASQHMVEYTPLIKPLVNDEFEPLAKYAAWALEKLEST